MTSSGCGGGATIPHLFRCPISLDLFTDPVTLCTGQTYDRPNIERWLAAGNLVCPVTMQRLRDPSLVPNHTLRHLINTWLLSAATVDDATASGGGGDLTLGALKRSLQSPGASMQSKLEMLEKVRLLALESDTGQSCLIQLGFVPLLTNLLFGAGPGTSFSPEFAELALDSILGLANSPAQMAHLDVLREQGSSPSTSPSLVNMIQLFETGNARIKTRICRLIERIAGCSSTQTLCLLIGQNRRVLRTLAALLSRSGHTSSNASSNTMAGASDAAARALSSLCATAEPARVTALQEGALDGLVAYLSSGGSRPGAALATLERLAVLESGMSQLLGNPNGVRVLVKMVFRVSAPDDGGSEHAVRTLLLACCASPAARAEAVNAGVLSQLLLLLQSQCGCKAKNEARALLKLLRSMWADEARQRRDIE